MTQAQKNAVKEVAGNALKTAKITSELPVDVEKVAKSIGLKVEYFPFPDEISGLLKKEKGIVGINESQNTRRQRFTLAHEVGHYLLGHQIINDNDLIDDTNTDTSSPIEREANYFASCLLMPEDLVRKNTKAKFQIGSLADLFNVSEQAMTIRVMELGLIK